MVTLPNDHISKQFDSVELEMSCTKLCIYLTLVKKEKLFSSFFTVSTGVAVGSTFHRVQRKVIP